MQEKVKFLNAEHCTVATIFGVAFAAVVTILIFGLSVSAKHTPLIQKRSGGMSLTPLSPAQPVIRSAEYLREHGEIEKALTLYTQAIKLDPKASAAYIGRARVWEEFGKLDKALADFNFAFKNDIPFNRTAARFRGDLYQSMHRYQDAINDYSLLLVDGPTDGLFFSRGNCYLKINKPAMAINDFTRAVGLGGNRSLTYERRGDAYLSLKQDAKALADYNSALKIDPEGNVSKDGHEHLHKCKAEIYKRLGKLDLAKKEAAAAAVGRNANVDFAPFASDSLK